MWFMGLVVAVTDAAITFFGLQRLDGWLTGRKVHVLLWDAALTVALGINTIGIAEYRWPMLGASVLGSAIGVLLSFRWKVV